MKKILFTLIFSFIFLNSIEIIAQDAEQSKKPRINEVGLTFSGLNQFGINYKLEKKNNWYWRFSSLAASGNSVNNKYDSITDHRSDYNIGFNAGIEKRIHINSDFQFRYGFAASTYLNFTKSHRETNDKKEKIFSIAPGAAVILGFNYLIGEHFLVSAEFAPRVYYRYTKETTQYGDDDEIIEKANTLGFSANTNSISITIAYRFWKGQD